ncbi:MAG: lanthionine synthetase LanC family protein, partial [Candidatus Heimdallarchaeota archaeon]
NGLDDGLEGYSWGYGLFSKTPITDIQYGVAGISSTFIKAYQLNLNITYLNFASQGLKWILTQSGIDKNTTDGQRFIRFSPDPFYPFLFSGFLTGNSGIGKILLDYYNITKNEDFLVFAIQIGNWLVATETNGLWDYGGADLLTGTSNEEGSFLGFGAGSSGIGIFLLELFEYTNDVKYLKSVKGIENILEQEAIIEENFRYWNIQASGNFEDIVSTDIKLGISGIGLFYSKLYNFFGLNSSLNILHEIDNYFKSLIIKFNYLPAIVDINADVLNNDLSFLDGLAGVATFYLDVIKSLKSTPKYDKTIYFSLDLNNNSLSFGFNFFTLVSLIIIIKIFYNRKLLK